jgi:hypothetical protein
MHNATKGLLPTQSLGVTPVDGETSQAEPEAPIEGSRLAPWLTWLEKVDFESWWDSNG